MPYTRMFLAVLLVVVLVPVAALAQEKDPPPLPKDAQEAKDAVSKHLDRIGGLKQQPGIEWVGDKSVQEVFPSTTFFAVRYRQWPVAIAPPEGLVSSNVLAVAKDGKIKVLKSATDLANFYVDTVQPGAGKVTEQNVETYSKAWLNLSQELVQDGFYKFEIQKPSIMKANNVLTVMGKSMVTQGGNGDITVTIAFLADGSVTATQKHQIKMGPRPKCQATKLLDPDPIVRYMAHSELLFMGLPARAYLLEQKASASDPLLSQAIDRMLQRIEEAGW